MQIFPKTKVFCNKRRLFRRKKITLLNKNRWCASWKTSLTDWLTDNWNSRDASASKKVLRCISLGPAFIFLAITQTHLRLAFCCSTKLFSYPTGAIFWIIWIVIRHCQADDGGGVGRSQCERRRQAVELWRTGGEEKEWRPLLYSSAFYEPSIT